MGHPLFTTKTIVCRVNLPRDIALCARRAFYDQNQQRQNPYS